MLARDVVWGRRSMCDERNGERGGKDEDGKAGHGGLSAGRARARYSKSVAGAAVPDFAALHPGYACSHAEDDASLIRPTAWRYSAACSCCRVMSPRPAINPAME